MAIEVFEPVAIHEAVILRRPRRAAAGSNGFRHQRIHFLAALAALLISRNCCIRTGPSIWLELYPSS